jgi:hypothetical protein
MPVLNRHARRYLAGPEAVGTLIDGLGSREDHLWPKERWPALILDGPLDQAPVGGHGPIRYSVQEYTRGRRIVFRFTGPPGFDGTHRFELHPATEGSELEHVIDMKVRGSAILTWPLLFRPLHDALLEDALDKAEAYLTGVDWAPRPFPWTVRVLRRMAARRGRR